MQTLHFSAMVKKQKTSFHDTNTFTHSDSHMLKGELQDFSTWTPFSCFRVVWGSGDNSSSKFSLQHDPSPHHQCPLKCFRC